MRNHVKLGVSPRILYCVVDTGYGLGRSLGDCRPALPKGRKYQMVKTQTKPQDEANSFEKTEGRYEFSFLLESVGGQLDLSRSTLSTGSLGVLRSSLAVG